MDTRKYETGIKVSQGKREAFIARKTMSGTTKQSQALGPIGLWSRRIFVLLAIVPLLLAVSPWAATPAAAADVSCNCVAYVRSQTGLPGGPATAAGYTESWMNAHGYRRIMPQNPRINGAIMVWDANQKGARSSGHMAIVAGTPRYNAGTKKWTINVRHANWGGCGIRSTPFQWGDLYGVNFYVRK